MVLCMLSLLKFKISYYVMCFRHFQPSVQVIRVMFLFCIYVVSQ